MSQFQTLKSNLTKSRIINEHFEVINKGEILVKLRVAFTANNVTYGVAGDTIGYWKFFPAAQNENNEWGCIPMWGFAEIIESNIHNLYVGERLFGYFPAADSLVLNPIKISDQALVTEKAQKDYQSTTTMSDYLGRRAMIHQWTQSEHYYFHFILLLVCVTR